MKPWIVSGLAALTLTLGACDSGDVPSPADQLGADPVTAAQFDPAMVALHGDGLVAGAEAFYFAAGRNEVETALAKSLGDATEAGSMEECGAGPMEFIRFKDGLTVNFQDGNLVGWYLNETAENLSVDADVAMGMAAEDVAKIPGYNAIEDSTLGEEFIISGQVAGFVEDDKVSMLYAGVQCFFR